MVHAKNKFHVLVVSPKADNHFTIPYGVEGWVDLDGWLLTQMVVTGPSDD